MVETFTPRFGAVTLESKVSETSQDGRGRSPVVWEQGIQLRPSMNLPRLLDLIPVDIASRQLISQSSVIDAISRLQQEKTRIKKDCDHRKADHDELKHRYDQLVKQRDKSRSNKNRVGDKLPEESYK